jgi:hypothetical protein
MKLSMLCATRSMLCAMAFTLGVSGAALAADQPQSPPQATMTPQPTQPATPQQNQPTQSDQDGSARRDRDYQAALKQCDNSTDRERCVDAVRRKFGQM